MIMTNVWVLDHKKKVIKIDHKLNMFGIKLKRAEVQGDLFDDQNET